MTDRVRLDIKYIGWNMGQYGHERNEIKAAIEILELKIDGVNILKQLEVIKTWYQKNNQSYIVDWDALSEILEGEILQTIGETPT